MSPNLAKFASVGSKLYNSSKYISNLNVETGQKECIV